MIRAARATLFRLRCLLLGHRWHYPPPGAGLRNCKRCGRVSLYDYSYEVWT